MATTGDFHLATRGDFLMATHNRRAMMSRSVGWWRNHRGAGFVYGVVAAASLIVGAASVIIWKPLKLSAQTWAAVIAAVAAVGATLIALKALSYTRQSTDAADRAARAAENQTKLQEQIRIETAQPYVWVDVRPDDSTGVLLNLAVGNGGPTLATNGVSRSILLCRRSTSSWNV